MKTEGIREEVEKRQRRGRENKKRALENLKEKNICIENKIFWKKKITKFYISNSFLTGMNVRHKYGLVLTAVFYQVRLFHAARPAEPL